MNNSEGQTQEPVGGMKSKEEVYTIFCPTPTVNNIYAAMEFYAKQFKNPPPAPIKTEGEDEIKNIKDGLPVLMALVRVGYQQASTEILNYCNDNKVSPPFLEKLIEMLNPENKKQFVYDLFKNELAEVEAGYSASLPQSSTEEEKELVEKLKYVDHVLSDDGYQSESEIRSIVKDVMNYFKRNL